MKNDFATLEDISYTESLLLPEKQKFDDDKVKIIRCNSSSDIKACPGSGKTTTLLAKLAILANRMPFENNQGICVLTHTNVAINEIKNKLGHKSDILFSYPNHFGTIQSFVDKFLAIPYYRSVYRKPPKEISNDAYNHFFKRALHANNSFLLKQKKEDLKKKINHFFGANNSHFQNLRIKYNQGEVLLWDLKWDKEIEIKKPKGARKYEDWTNFQKEEIKRELIKIVKNTWDYYGVFSFYDAFTLSKCYIEKSNSLKEILHSRFRYVFIDEMQDTDTHQLEIIEKIFDREDTVIQFFGDPNQSIFNKTKAENIWNPGVSLPINSSKRFGEDIAKILRSVCMVPNANLQANDEIYSLKPHLIIFENPKDVLEKYCELVTSLEAIWTDGSKKTISQIAQEENKAIKAIGWVGEPNSESKKPEHLTIQSYFKSFRKDIKKKEKVNFDSLKSFIKKQSEGSVKDYSNKIIMAFLHILSCENKKPSGGGKRNYTKTSLLSELRETTPEIFKCLNTNIANWSIRVHNSTGFDKDVYEEIKTYIKSTFLNHFGINTPNKYTINFLNNEPDDSITEKEIQSNNTFSCDQYNNVNIELGTIHSVKGETHTATLLLETSYYGKHESERILEQLKGNTIVRKNRDSQIIETLKMAYVAMSRPKYLLCMAIHKDRYNEDLDITKGGLWKIVKTF